MRPSQLLAAVLAMSSVTAAMPDAFANIHGLGDVKNIFVRQNDNSASSSGDQSSNQPSPTSAAESSGKASATGNNDGSKTTGKATTSGSQKASGSKTTSKKATSYDARLPAGGISMVTPGALAGSQFYKVGDYVTFAWNYTSLSQTPSHLDILASCTANQATYTIAVNQSADQTQVVWDTKNTPSGQVPFLTEKYTLLIYDAASSVSAAPQAGYLAVFNSFTFGMYTPQPYVPFSEFQCANCNGALSQFEKMTLKALLLTTGTTIGSLIYFTYAFGLW